MIRRAFVFLVLWVPFTVSGQVKDKRWWLIDSVDFGKMIPAQRGLIDSFLTLYHKEKNDTLRISLLLDLAEAIEEENVWVRYNQIALEMATRGGNKRVYLKHKAAALNNMGF